MVLVALYVLSDILVLLAQAVILAIKEPAVMPVLLVISQVQVDAYHVLTWALFAQNVVLVLVVLYVQ